MLRHQTINQGPICYQDYIIHEGLLNFIERGSLDTLDGPCKRIVYIC